MIFLDAMPVVPIAHEQIINLVDTVKLTRVEPLNFTNGPDTRIFGSGSIYTFEVGGKDVEIIVTATHIFDPFVVEKNLRLLSSTTRDLSEFNVMYTANPYYDEVEKRIIAEDIIIVANDSVSQNELSAIIQASNDNPNLQESLVQRTDSYQRGQDNHTTTSYTYLPFSPNEDETILSPGNISEFNGNYTTFSLPTNSDSEFARRNTHGGDSGSPALPQELVTGDYSPEFAVTSGSYTTAPEIVSFLVPSFYDYTLHSLKRAGLNKLQNIAHQFDSGTFTSSLRLHSLTAIPIHDTFDEKINTINQLLPLGTKYLENRYSGSGLHFEMNISQKSKTKNRIILTITNSDQELTIDLPDVVGDKNIVSSLSSQADFIKYIKAFDEFVIQDISDISLLGSGNIGFHRGVINFDQDRGTLTHIFKVQKDIEQSIFQTLTRILKEHIETEKVINAAINLKDFRIEKASAQYIQLASSSDPTLIRIPYDQLPSIEGLNQAERVNMLLQSVQRDMGRAANLENIIDKLSTYHQTNEIFGKAVIVIHKDKIEISPNLSRNKSFISIPFHSVDYFDKSIFSFEFNSDTRLFRLTRKDWNLTISFYLDSINLFDFISATEGQFRSDEVWELVTNMQSFQQDRMAEIVNIHLARSENTYQEYTIPRENPEE